MTIIVQGEGNTLSVESAEKITQDDVDQTCEQRKNESMCNINDSNVNTERNNAKNIKTV